MGLIVGDTNVVRAESDRMIAGLLASGPGLNRWNHNHVPTPLDHQTTIRMNRDTLYSLAVVDISQGATVTLPDADGRYLSVMVVNQDHYVNRIFHDPGTYTLTQDAFDTPDVAVAARILVDADSADDLAVVAALQDGLGLSAASADPFVMPDYDEPR